MRLKFMRFIFTLIVTISFVGCVSKSFNTSKKDYNVNIKGKVIYKMISRDFTTNEKIMRISLADGFIFEDISFKLNSDLSKNIIKNIQENDYVKVKINSNIKKIMIRKPNGKIYFLEIEDNSLNDYTIIHQEVYKEGKYIENIFNKPILLRENKYIKSLK